MQGLKPYFWGNLAQVGTEVWCRWREPLLLILLTILNCCQKYQQMISLDNLIFYISSRTCSGFTWRVSDCEELVGFLTGVSAIF